jgi:hypothetical protein
MQSKFKIVEDTDEYILLQDMDPDGKSKRVDQDAHAVVKFLYNSGWVVDSEKQIIYQDPEGDAVELYHDGDGNFEGFGFTQLD